MIFRISFVFCVCLLTGCASYQSRLSPARQDLVNGQCGKALATLQDLSSKTDGDQLVYLMDYGSALQICKEYKKSNEIFLKADKLSEQIDYQSVSRVAGATLLNEEMIQYKGDTFEKLFINASAALNYLQLGETDEALVEVRRINEKFKKFNADDKKKFELNSFSQYLSGLIWELNQKYDDACISYKAAYQIDSTSRQVALDMLRGCWLARRTQEYDELLKQVQPTAEELKKVKQKSKDEFFVIFMQGWGPRKEPRPENHLFPHLVPVSSVTQSLQIDVVDNSSLEQKYISQPVYNVEQAAIQTLNDDYKTLIARRVGARVAKEVLADQIRQKDKTLGNIAWLVMVASERADLRQWSTLPQSIHVLRLSAPKGSFTMKLKGLDRNQNVSEVFEEVSVGAGQRQKIYLVRSLK